MKQDKHRKVELFEEARVDRADVQKVMLADERQKPN
jgi:hypothetical protein